MAPYKEFASLVSSSSTTSSPSVLSSLTSIPNHDPETMGKIFLEYLSKASDPSYTPADRGPMVFQFSIATTVLTTVAVFLRFWSRRMITKRWSSDDWAILAANGWMLASTILNCIGLSQGAIGKHLSDVVFLQPFSRMAETQSLVTFAIKLAFAYQLLYLLTLLFIKLSLLLFYRRLLGPNTGGRLIPIVYATIGILVVYTIVAVFLLIFQCKPVKAYWTPEIHTKYCPTWDGGLRRLYFGVLVVSVGSDFWVLGFPVVIVWRLHISGWKKIGCVLVFSLGILACVAAVIRLYLVHTRPMYKDITWDYVLLVFWGQAEIATAIICACLPALKQLFQHTFQKIKAKSIHSSSSYTSGAPSTSFSTSRHPPTVTSTNEKTTAPKPLNFASKSIDLELALSGEKSTSTLSTSTTPTSTTSPSRPLADEASLSHIIYQYQPPAPPPPTQPSPALQLPLHKQTPLPPTPTSPSTPISPLTKFTSTASSSSSSSSSSVRTIGTFALLPPPSTTTTTTPRSAKHKKSNTIKGRHVIKEPKRVKGMVGVEGFEEWEKRFTWSCGPNDDGWHK